MKPLSNKVCSAIGFPFLASLTICADSGINVAKGLLGSFQFLR